MSFDDDDGLGPFWEEKSWDVANYECFTQDRAIKYFRSGVVGRFQHLHELSIRSYSCACYPDFVLKQSVGEVNIHLIVSICFN